MLGRLSLRYKYPINLSLAILLTGLVVATVLIWRVYGEVREELFRHSVELGRALSKTLMAALKHEDVWQAYQVLKAASAGEGQEERLLVLLDSNEIVFVSNRPKDFPTLSVLRDLSPEVARLEDVIKKQARLEPFRYELGQDSRLYMNVPLVDDGVSVGMLIVGYPRTIFRPQLLSIARRVAMSTLVVMAVLVPIGWYVGDRTVAPLLELARGMRQVGSVPLAEIRDFPTEGDDEIGQLGRHFRKMVRELEEKQNLERRMMVSERLAALGRLAAGLAHEINNPLGGMINAIKTYRRFGKTDPVTEKTVSLLERGLAQIQETVSALLVEAKAESHGLKPEDIDDVHTLVHLNAQRKSLTLVWQNELEEELPVPSTPVRQMLLNLSLNAVQAARDGGYVALKVGRSSDLLDIRVENDGRTISSDELNLLLEPFAHRDPAGTGLGLWVTYQIVQQLNGELRVESEEGTTCFRVQLPIGEAA